MTEKVLTINPSKDEIPVAIFVQTASKFSSSIKVNIDNKVANAKSIMGMFSIGLASGVEVKISAEGEDSEQAVRELANLLA